MSEITGQCHGWELDLRLSVTSPTFYHRVSCVLLFCLNLILVLFIIKIVLIGRDAEVIFVGLLTLALKYLDYQVCN